MPSPNHHPRIRTHLKAVTSKVTTHIQSLFVPSSPQTSPTLPKSAHRLADDLKTAVPTELPFDGDEWANHEYRHVLRRIHGEHVADGVWICSQCSTDNALMHFKGDHPFKYLVCRACEHVYCRSCSTSDISLGEVLAEEKMKEGFNIGNGLFGVVCSNCGLTHRGEMEANCPCGDGAHDGWIRFAIGNNFEYRRDPEACLVELKLQRAMTGVELNTLLRNARNKLTAKEVRVPSSPSNICINAGGIGLHIV